MGGIRAHWVLRDLRGNGSKTDFMRLAVICTAFFGLATGVFTLAELHRTLFMSLLVTLVVGFGIAYWIFSYVDEPYTEIVSEESEVALAKFEPEET